VFMRLASGYNHLMADATEWGAMDWAKFLASSPPDSPAEISNLCRRSSTSPNASWAVGTPDLLLYCDSEECQGLRFFECKDGTTWILSAQWKHEFMNYVCRNCRKTVKTYAVKVRQKEANSSSGWATKLGEIPPFGPHTPARLITLIGPDRELFLKGRRAENRGLGIGAFSYYRRVVENQKGRIIVEIAKVAKKLGAKADVLEEFKAAEKETQFSTAVDQIKHGIPEALLIDGQHNPLTLLHHALSEGMHERTDEECLEVAQDIRVVLTELADRLSQALKQEDELTKSVTRLLTRKAKPAAAVAEAAESALPKGKT
jgi:hypothetical protein